MTKLKLYDNYSREEIHEIFAPFTTFTPQAGIWGLQGIVPIPERPNDFVFFVTLGKQQGAHIFEEGITEEGVLSWQSQPSQLLQNSKIQQFIKHDEAKNSIYLFFRTHNNLNYTYLGNLKYLSHDKEREKPVWFQWQILDWKPPQDLLDQMGLVLQPAPKQQDTEKPALEVGNLIEIDLPSFPERSGKTTATFRTKKIADRSADDARNRKLGLAGELLVMEFEKSYLIEIDRPDLAQKVRHVAQIEGDGAGYDILSFTESGEEKFIEVKTTRGNETSSFFMSQNEYDFADTHQDHYYLYRVFDFEIDLNKGTFFTIKAENLFAFIFTPIQFRVNPQ